jgi:hypothetical protein
VRIVQSQPMISVDFAFILQMFVWRDAYIRDRASRITPQPIVYRFTFSYYLNNEFDRDY